MSNSWTSAAATSSWVDSGFEAHRTTSAPPAFSVRIRFAVSLVTCMTARRRDSRPAAARGRTAPGSRPAPASAGRPSRSAARPRGERRILHVVVLGRCRWLVSLVCGPVWSTFVVCRDLRAETRRSGGEQPLVLALLPVDPGARIGAGEPAVDCRSSGSRRRRAAKAISSRSTENRSRSVLSDWSRFSSKSPYMR